MIDNRARILAVGETPARRSGLGNCMRELVEKRLAKRYRVDVAGWFDDGPKACKYQVSKYDYHKEEAKRHRATQIIEILEKEPYDIVFTMGDPFYFEDMVEVKSRTRAKWLMWVTVDGEPLGKWYYNGVLFNADELVGFSQYARRVIRAENPHARVPVIYPGYDYESEKTPGVSNVYVPMPLEKRAAVRANEAPTGERLTFLWAGQNTNRKQLQIFIKAAEQVRDKLLQDDRDLVRFVIISDMREPFAPHNMQKQLERVQAGPEFHWVQSSPDDPVPDDKIARWMQVADYFVTTSVGEGFGMLIHQAKACGCPIIGPLHTSIEEQVAPVVDGGYLPCGYPVSKGSQILGECEEERFVVNHDEIANAMMIAYEEYATGGDAWESFRQNCIETARPHTWDACAAQFSEIIDKLHASDGRFLGVNLA